jgi:hypothetical protein
MAEFAPHNMSGNSAPPPYVASASSEFSSSFAAWKAFDNAWSAGQYWIGNSAVEWLKIDLGAGASKLLETYKIQLNDLNEPLRAPKDWLMQGSNDNSAWDTLDTVTNQTGWANQEERTFTCDTQVAGYRYFRINISANNGDSLTQIGELWLQGVDFSAGDIEWDASDAISLSDAIVALPLVPLLFEDAIALSDSILLFGGYLVSDQILITDEVAVLVISHAKKVWAILVGDTLTLGDGISTATSYVTTTGDSYTLLDGITVLLTRALTFSDSISLSDASLPNLSFGDAISLSDFIDYLLVELGPTDFSFLISDQLAVNDSVVLIEVPEFISVGDTLILSDLVFVRNQARLNNYLRRYLNDVSTPIS